MTKVGDKIGTPDYSDSGAARTTARIAAAGSFEDFLLEVEKGNVEGHRLIHKFGRNPSVDTGAAGEDIWFAATQTAMDWPTTAETLNVVSDNANDDGSPTNTGAQTIRIAGLDVDFNEITEDVTLDGTTPVTTAQEFTRVDRAYVLTSGTYHGSNIGTITCDQTTSGDLMFVIAPGAGQTTLARYTVPAGFSAYVTAFDLWVDAQKTAQMIGKSYRNADDVSQPYDAERIWVNLDGVSGPIARPIRGGIPFPEKTDIWWTAVAAVDNTSVSVNFGILLVEI